MKNRLLTLTVLISWVVSGILIPISLPVKANTPSWSFMSFDADNDGLSDQIEEAGWCNEVGCFTTDPLDPDSDNDGLTDGEEKLLEAHPGNDDSPGIYVFYDSPLKTREYYPWQQYGHKLIARGDAVGNDFNPPNPDDIDVKQRLGVNLNAAVVRRGATFLVGGPIEATLQIAKSISSLSNLTSTRNPFTGEWQVTVPATGTVGKYTLSLGGNSLDLFVIFELPTPTGELTQLGVEKFVYDDNPAKSYDELAVVLGDDRYPPKTGSPYDELLIAPDDPSLPSADDAVYIAEGLPYTFRNQQYNRFVLEDYVISAINGKTDLRSAAAALTDRVDALTVFRNPIVRYDSWQVLNPGVNPRQQCSNVAGLLTAFMRSVGIPARPIMIDWRKGSFDHATEVWMNNQWRVYRGYNRYEMAEVPDDTRIGCSSSVWPQCGTDKDISRSSYGSSEYQPWHSNGNGAGNVMVLAGDTWTGTGLAYRWPSWDWDVININPNRMATQNSKYWVNFGWTQEPVNRGNPGWPPPPPTPPQTLTLGGLNTTSFAVSSSPVQIGDIIAEYGLDSDGDGRYDQLIFEVQIVATEPGPYWLWGELSASRSAPALQYSGGIVTEALAPLELVTGSQVVRLAFSGTDIGVSNVDGPYHLSNLRITNVDSPGASEFMNNSLAYRLAFYSTAAYQASQFEDYGAILSDSYTHSTTDSNGDGYPDALVINTSLKVSQPGVYTIEASLYGNEGEAISHATWTGSGSNVTLQFDNLAGSVGPYTLEQVSLLNAEGQSIDQSGLVAYTVEPIVGLMAPSVSLDVYSNGDGLSTQGTTITPTNVFTEALVDGNLQIGAGVTVAQAGSFKLEAWLTDSAGNLVTWASSQPTNLAVGSQSLGLTFDGHAIRAHGLNGPFTVVAVKVLDGNTNYTVLDKVDVAFTTQPYNLNQFAGINGTLLEDTAESDGSKWTADSGWTIIPGSYLYFNPSKAWVARNVDASLMLKDPLNLSTTDKVGLKFHSSYRFRDGEAGYVEGSMNGGVTWTPVATLTGSSTWSNEPQIIDLGAYARRPAVLLRFRLDSVNGASSSGYGWYISNMVIIGKPDRDLDGIIDEDEIGFGTNPDNPDTDGDALPDGWEVDHNLNPLDPTGDNGAMGDPDHDGLNNITEYNSGTDPRNPDTDGDGLLDGWEVQHGFDPLDPTGDNGASGDPDDDGLSNGDEQQLGTDPNDPDTDDDGLIDSVDPAPGRAMERLYLPFIVK